MSYKNSVVVDIRSKNFGRPLVRATSDVFPDDVKSAVETSKGGARRLNVSTYIDRSSIPVWTLNGKVMNLERFS